MRASGMAMALPRGPAATLGARARCSPRDPCHSSLDGLSGRPPLSRGNAFRPCPRTRRAGPCVVRSRSLGRVGMDRRDFMQYTGFGLAGLMLPGFGNAVAAETLATTMDVAVKKAVADTALGAARDAGATYCDVRV